MDLKHRILRQLIYTPVLHFPLGTLSCTKPVSYPSFTITKIRSGNRRSHLCIHVNSMVSDALLLISPQFSLELF